MLTGRARLNIKRRWFGRDLVVLEVERKWTRMTSDPYDYGTEVTTWSPATPEELIEYKWEIK